MTFLQEQASGETEPYDVGQEFVLFLRWDSFLPQDSFVRLIGPMVVFVIQDGRVQRGLSPAVDRYARVTIDEFLAELRALAAR